MKLVVGCDLEEFRKYYKETRGDLNTTEEYYIQQDPSHLILWRDGDQILGHAIWHETNTEEHREGDPRDKTDKELLHQLLGGRKDFVELHELWLKKEHRGKGYGRSFFEFFEDFIARKGFEHIIYYANDPAALAICRKRGYREAYGVELNGETYYVLCLSLKNR